MFENFKQVTEHLLAGKMVSHKTNGQVYKINNEGHLICIPKQTLDLKVEKVMWLLDELAAATCLTKVELLEPYVPPPKTIKVALYRYQKEQSSGWFQSSKYFETDTDFKSSLGYNKVTGFVRLNNTEIEVEEEIDDDDFLECPVPKYKTKTKNQDIFD